MIKTIVKKDFWKFFFSNLWNARYIFLKSSILAIMWIVLSIFTNRLDLTNLTIYNSVLTISLFFEWISWGFGNSIVVLVNNNVNNKEKIKTIISNILTISFVFLTCIAILVGVFKNFTLKNIVSLTLEVPNKFFYCMLAYGFISAFSLILTYILQAFESFKSQLFVSLIQAFLFIIGFVTIFFTNNLNLNIIGFVFLTIISIIFIVLTIILLKNKKQNINIFKIEKFGLSKSESFSVINIAGIQLVYIIGHTCISLFLLKRNELVFNSYQYLENVLDIFNGIFFSFCSFITIKISQCISDKKYDEAYKIGEYSFYSTFFIWIIYVVLSLIAYIPYIQGANAEIREILSRIYFVYIGLFIFRFLSWNFSTYILSAGGKAHLQVILETIGAIYFVLLLIFAKQILNNEYLLLTLVFADTIVKTPIFIWYFKSKKWLPNK